MFADALGTAERYAALLAGPARERGLMGPREVPRLWDRHILNCAVLTELVPSDATVCDVGSGAGLPGLVVAIRRPDLRVTLVEPLLRRTLFLQEAVESLALSNVEVVRGRAEALHGTRTFDVVTSRAVAAMKLLLEWSLPLVNEGGVVLAMKGESARTELDEASDTIARLGGLQPEVLTIEEEGLSFPTTVVRVEAGPSARIRWGTAPRTAKNTSRRRPQKRR
ncbi:MAG: 16S rRNA (guanine(527)-N(7))-methyltransferase [uncultured Nocardioidaceae bacterium]|uniref:Ribosomal RNA small subunit methyltransferase G n=1 Tax=uncultured Nocardioidaceae bacterium TaxID=253824 RepID=A0A6J4NS08_9ACTN|nr:MAG: 16S rRNA (guanine(527)-N(7))-methyltransferase [uncultured Nocardioidaceae bacterium]